MTSLAEIYSAILTGVQNLNLIGQAISASTISSAVGQLNGIVVNGEVVAWPTSPSSEGYPYGSFRAASSNYGSLWYNDGTTLHLLATQPSFGPDNGATPFSYNMSTDAVTFAPTTMNINPKIAPANNTAAVTINPTNPYGVVSTSGGFALFIGDGSTSSATPSGGGALIQMLASSNYSNDPLFYAKNSGGTNTDVWALNSSGEIVGRSDGSVASAGTYGEIQLFVNSSGTTLSVSSAGSLVSMGSFTPTAGTYLVWGSVFASVATNPVENITVELRLGSTSGTQLGAGSITNTANALGSQTLTITPQVLSLIGSTAIFLMALVAWTGSTPSVTGTGNIQALRVR